MSWFRKPTPPVSPPEVPSYFFEGGKLSVEQIDRKVRSEAILHRLGVRINPHLPCIAASSEIPPRSASEIYQRFAALTLVAVRAEEKANGDPEGDIDDFIREKVDELNARDWFSPAEHEFLANPDPDHHDCVQFVWRYEAAAILLWSLGEGDAKLSTPCDMCDVGMVVRAVRDGTVGPGAVARPVEAILDEADLVYRFRWAVRQSSLDGVPTGGTLEPSVVMERHYALNWLTRYADSDWDEVTTDT